MPLFLSIDVGTSSVKCIVVDEKLNTVKSATIAQDFMQPAPLHTEQDPDMWWDNTKLALKEMFVKLMNKLLHSTDSHIKM